LCNLGFGLGAAAVAGAVIWWVVSDDDARPSEQAKATRVSPMLGRHQLGLVLRGALPEKL
jgi:hypothetical protein